ncbi:YdcF family protein [Kozakia baliensis]|uniref:YdcF family protein n=1 Tax=Kozakia baliensis TaxID=153496 RepID=UPI000AD1421A|nr:YdcF family protein [Kozakia baliensis]
MKTLRLSMLFLAMPGLIWLAGLLWFGRDALSVTPHAVKCDGIVALTGGKDRIETSLDLLHRSYGQILLISGVGSHATLAQLAGKSQAFLTPEFSARITLGRRAVSTVGNGTETAEWAHSNHLHTLLVVTAGYHIRRAMMEIQRAAPDVILHPYPVRPPALRRPLDKATVTLLVREYNKWLGAQLGLSRGTNLTPAA